VRLAVPKAYIVLASGWEPNAETALAIFSFSRERLAPYKRIRRLEFAELPKTISGKIRRVDLRRREQELHAAGDRGAEPVGPDGGGREFSEEEFPGLR
jgi:acetyl-CoA synthetase